MNKNVKRMQNKTSLWVQIRNARFLYLLLVPGFLYFILFKYLPMGWLVISFQDYKLLKGIEGSKWIGFKNFIDFFQNPDCWMIIKNTLVLNIYSLIFAFPVTVIFALFLNEVRKGGKDYEETRNCSSFDIGYDGGNSGRMWKWTGGRKDNCRGDDSSGC